MQRARSSSGVLLLSALVVIAAALVLLRPPDAFIPGDRSIAAQGPTDERPKPRPINRITAALHAEDLGSVMHQWRAAPSVPGISPGSLRKLADQSCRVPELLRMDGRDQPDWRRDRFRSELEKRCRHRAVPSLFVREHSPDDFFDDTASGLSVTQALIELRRARNAVDLRLAWWSAYRIEALPQAEIFADGRQLLPDEARQLIEVVIDWRQCARYRACGPDSLLTLRVCAMHGCTGDEDLLGAWHQALSPRDFEAALAISRWLPTWPAADE